MPGRTIKIHLLEGTPHDIMTAEIVVSWTGKVIMAPRTKMAQLAVRPEVQRAGVYVLVGDDPDFPGKERVYIGESDNVLIRLKQHFAGGRKDFWDHTIIVTSKDEHLTKSLVKYLESRLVQMVVNSGRAILDNGAQPPNPHLPESDLADMEYFLQQIQIILPVMGYSFIVPAPVPTLRPSAANEMIGRESNDIQQISSNRSTSDSPLFILSIGDAEAQAQEVGGEFVVLRGSTARNVMSPSAGRSNLSIREALVREGKLIPVENSDLFTFMADVPFKSTSAAATAISGTSQAGPRVWKVRGANLTYNDWQQASLARLNGVGIESSEEVEETSLDDLRDGVDDEFAEPDAFDIIEDLGWEMDLMEDPASHRWTAYFTQRAYEILQAAGDEYLYVKDGREFVKVWENDNVGLKIHMLVGGIDNDIPNQGNLSRHCRREMND